MRELIIISIALTIIIVFTSCAKEDLPILAEEAVQPIVTPTTPPVNNNLNWPYLYSFGPTENMYFHVDCYQNTGLTDKYELLDSIIYSNRRTGETHRLGVAEHRQLQPINNTWIPAFDSILIKGTPAQFTTKIYLPPTFLVGDTLDTRIIIHPNTSNRYIDVHMHRINQTGYLNNSYDGTLVYTEMYVIDYSHQH